MKNILAGSEFLKGMRDGIRKAGSELNEDHVFIADKGRHVDGYDLMKHVLENYHLESQTIVMVSLPVLEGAIECIKHECLKPLLIQVISSYRGVPESYLLCYCPPQF